MVKDNSEIELPKLKKIESNTDKQIIINEISKTYRIYDIKTIIRFTILGILFVIVGVIFLVGFGKKVFIKENNVTIFDIEIVNYYLREDVVDIAVVPSTEQSHCAIADNGSNDVKFQKLSNDKCYLTVPLTKQYVYFKNKNGIVSKKLEINNYVVHVEVDEKKYVPLNVEQPIYDSIVSVGKPEIKWVTLGDIVTIKNDYFFSKNIGTTKLQAMVNNKVVATTEVISTDVIVKRPKTFDNEKDYLSCEVYTAEEAKLLDEILESRIEKAGYGTRAGAVEAARFLTLEFPYRISYYWENGRLNNTGRHYVDGEGRYYHKGLYLDKSKYDSIEASLFGPAMWGCKMVSYEDDPPYFVPGNKYPNGLDCSGFVTWALLNGGFDVGDRGAGESPSKGQLTDLGEFRKLTNTLINSGEIKVGDLFNFWGHISILIGQDENNYYIAESLNNYKGLVVKTYSKKKVMNTFKYVVLMDSVYNGDGNLTDMWY